MQILVVASGAGTHQNCLNALKRSDYSFNRVGSGDECLTLLSASASRHFVILDTISTAIDGPEFCRRLRRLSNSRLFYLVILLSADIQIRIADFLEAGADDYLVGSVTAEQIQARIIIADRTLSLRADLITKTASDSEIYCDDEEIADNSKKSFRRHEVLTAAIEQSKIPVLLTTADLDSPGPEIVFANSGFSEMTGYPFKEIIGRNPRFLQGAETDRELMKRLRFALE